MATRPKIPARWPISQEQRRTRTIELADYGIALLDDARNKLDGRDHPALTKLDIADATRMFAEIKALMHEAKFGHDGEKA